MCGRYTFHSSPKRVAAHFKIAEMPLFEPRYNVAPTQQVFAVRVSLTGRARSGLAPLGAYSKLGGRPSIGDRMINARSETVADKPAYRHAFRKRRCLIAADGFYEWQKAKQTEGKKQPFYIRMRDGEPFAFAGLWESWGKGGEPIESCTILTTQANDLMRRYMIGCP